MIFKHRKVLYRVTFVLSVAAVFMLGPLGGTAPGADSSFDPAAMSDMSDFDPNNFQQPEGDTIKLGYLQIMSGAAAGNGELFWPVVTWVAHDINKRGGIMVDGKKKKIEILKGDTQGKPAAARKETERLCLEENVDLLWGTSGSHTAKAIADVAEEYKVPFLNCLSLSDELMNEKNFNRYTFRTLSNTTQWNMALSYYFSKRPETKFSILCQDYMYGHAMADAFKKYLNKYKPEAEIVSEDYHKLWLKDFAPYMTKIMAANPDILYTADWLPDGDNLINQARSMGVNLPIANIYITNPDTLASVGVEGTRNMIFCYSWMSGDTPQTKAQKKLMKEWHEQWKTWEAPYDSLLYIWPDFVVGQTISDTYWLFDVIQRTGTLDPEKIIKVWEDDVYKAIQGVRTMRAADHQAVFDMYVGEATYPTREVYEGAPYSEGYAGVHKVIKIPQKYCTPPVPEGLKDRVE
ncbi:MAG: ABC transporter substrate-binding protein [Desulfobacterales bacterium]|nr:ABC transporter substrate-binding protein [Desulfobacterales bacterium]MBS3756152.1 ABC transporter substrate-binding protein [Desulfobacterales bacterium]